MPTLTKKEVRRHCRIFRRSLSPEHYARTSEAICNHLLQSEHVSNARVIHCYWPLRKSREPDLTPFIAEVLRQSRRIILPVVSSYEEPAPGLNRVIHRAYAEGAPLMPNKWGIPEPVSGDTVQLDEVDLMIVPALAVDQAGYRIGYGAGYYDEILSGYRGATLCAVYASCIYEVLPREPHDLPVQQIVTENSLFRVSSVE